MNKIKLTLVVCILLLGLFLRLNNYDAYPQRGATSDEYAFAFLGISLIKEQKPIAWSAIPLYKDRFDLTVDKLYFPIVKPYLDHPPLFGLLVGGWSLLFGQDSFAKIQLQTIRLIPIILSVFSSYFVFLIGRRLYGFKEGIWALLIYETATVFAINSRVVLAESLLTPLLLLAVFLYVMFYKKISTKTVIFLGIISGLAFLSKVLGIVVFLSVVSFLIADKVKIKKILLLSSITGLFICAFIIYGLYFGGELFWQIQQYQSLRSLGPETLLTIISSPIIINKVFYDGWYFWGLFSLFFSFSDYKKNKFIILPSIIYLVLLMASVNKTDIHGWYMIPLFPFMALSSASVLGTVFKKNNWLLPVFSLLVGIWEIKYLYEIPFGLTPFVFRFFLFTFIGLPILLSLFNREKSYNILRNTLFYLFIFGSILITFLYKHPA